MRIDRLRPSRLAKCLRCGRQINIKIYVGRSSKLYRARECDYIGIGNLLSPEVLSHYDMCCNNCDEDIELTKILWTLWILKNYYRHLGLVE